MSITTGYERGVTRGNAVPSSDKVVDDMVVATMTEHRKEQDFSPKAAAYTEADLREALWDATRDSPWAGLAAAAIQASRCT